MNQLEQLKKFTTVVADTGDFETISKYFPQDATTNPSLIYLASQKDNYKHLIEDAISRGKNIEDILDLLFVNFGEEILKIIPGRVSIEVDARLSYDAEKSYEKAKKIIKLFEDRGIDRKRILIKLAATWEGIEVCKKLEDENIHCNITLLFSLIQAIGAAEANATIISPFVGRILDWHKKNNNFSSQIPHEDPGVISVKTIFDYYKKFNYSTKIMGASFRNVFEILELSGCDLLTISPNLLEILENSKEKIEKKLCEIESQQKVLEKVLFNKVNFEKLLSENKMASEKLKEGIFKFSEDIEKLEKLIKAKL